VKREEKKRINEQENVDGFDINKHAYNMLIVSDRKYKEVDPEIREKIDAVLHSMGA
jgi:hypothetical protein